eukprot:1994807-Pyramimonas_sp.AAC.1
MYVCFRRAPAGVGGDLFGGERGQQRGGEPRLVLLPADKLPVQKVPDVLVAQVRAVGLLHKSHTAVASLHKSHTAV